MGGTLAELLAAAKALPPAIADKVGSWALSDLIGTGWNPDAQTSGASPGFGLAGAQIRPMQQSPYEPTLAPGQTRSREDLRSMLGGVIEAAGMMAVPGVGPHKLEQRAPARIRPGHEAEFREWFKGSKVADEQGKPLTVYHGTTADFTRFKPSLSGKTGAAYDRANAMFFTDDPSVANDYAQYTGTEAFKNARIESVKAEQKFAEASKRIRGFVDKAWKPDAEFSYTMPERTNNILTWANDLLDRKVITRANYDEFIGAMDRMENAQAKADDLDIGGAALGANVKAAHLRLTNPIDFDASGMSWEHVMPTVVSKAKELGRDGAIVRNVIDTATGEPIKSNVYIVFRPENVKSATGNRGTYSPKSADIRE